MRGLPAIGLGLAILSLVGSAQAQQPKGIANLRETIIQLDTNGDQVVERDEVPEAGRDAFDRLLKRGDANKNGKLEIDELRNLFGKLRALAGTGLAGPERFKEVDKDGDGKISKEEFPGPEEAFARIDTDKDGFLSREEAVRFASATFGAPPRPNAERIRAMDKDGDGKISREEFTGPPPLFERLDADKDGFVTREEVAKLIGSAAGKPAAESPVDKPEPGKAAARPIAQRLLTMDKDGDGKISKAEFQGRPQLFERFDANKDGFITKDEIGQARPQKKDAETKPKAEG